MALVAGYISSAILIGFGGLAFSTSSKRAHVSNLLSTSRFLSVDEAHNEAKRAGSAYLAVQAVTTAPPSELFKAQFSGEHAIISETSVEHQFEERDVTQTQTPVFGSLSVTTSHSTWKRKSEILDTVIRGKTLFLSDGPNGKRLIRIPSSSVNLEEMLVTPPGGNVFSAGPIRPDQTPATPAGNNNNVQVVNVVNSSTQDLRTIGYKYHERIIRPNRSVIALAEMCVPSVDDVNNERSPLFDPNATDMKEQPYLYLKPEASTSTRPFLLSTKTKRELISEYDSSASNWKIASLILSGIGGSILAGTVYSHLRQ